MMSDIKMSELLGGQASVYDECMIKANGYKVASVSRGHAKHIAHAINSYDALVEQNAALRAALAELMDKAGECDSWESFPIQYLDDAQAALEQSK